MSWTKLEPVSPKSEPRVTARVVQSAAGLSLHVFLNKAIIEAHKTRPQTVEVSVGDGEDRGDLRLDFGKPGFTIARSAGATGRIQIPAPAWGPKGTTDTQPCSIAKRDGSELIISLPAGLWADKPAGRAPATAPSPRPKPAPAVPEGPAEEEPNPIIGRGETLDAVDYLKRKGVDARRIAGDRIQVNGEVAGMSQVLRMVNSRRLEAGLSSLELHQIR